MQDFERFNFYAPLKLDDGRTIYGCAAAAKRIANAGGHNVVAFELIQMGIRIGMGLATAKHAGR